MQRHRTSNYYACLLSTCDEQLSVLNIRIRLAPPSLCTLARLFKDKLPFFSYRPNHPSGTHLRTSNPPFSLPSPPRPTPRFFKNPPSLCEHFKPHSPWFLAALPLLSLHEADLTCQPQFFSARWLLYPLPAAPSRMLQPPAQPYRVCEESDARVRIVVKRADCCGIGVRGAKTCGVVDAWKGCVC